MFDLHARRIVDPVLNNCAQAFIRLPFSQKITPTYISIIGFCFGIACGIFLILHWYIWALCFLLLNRIFDGLDGIYAKTSHSTSDFGGYIDILLDFIFYQWFVIAFALGHLDNSLFIIAALCLILSFVGTGVSFLGYAIIAEKKQLKNPQSKSKSLQYVGGITEGFETIVIMVFICLFPSYFAFIAFGFTTLCIITTFSRILITKEICASN